MTESQCLVGQAGLAAAQVSPALIVDTSAPLDGTVSCPEFVRGLCIFFFADSFSNAMVMFSQKDHVLSSDSV